MLRHVRVGRNSSSGENLPTLNAIGNIGGNITDILNEFINAYIKAYVIRKILSHISNIVKDRKTENKVKPKEIYVESRVIR